MSPFLDDAISSQPFIVRRPVLMSAILKEYPVWY